MYSTLSEYNCACSISDLVKSYSILKMLKSWIRTLCDTEEVKQQQHRSLRWSSQIVPVMVLIGCEDLPLYNKYNMAVFMKWGWWRVCWHSDPLQSIDGCFTWWARQADGTRGAPAAQVRLCGKFMHLDSVYNANKVFPT